MKSNTKCDKFISLISICLLLFCTSCAFHKTAVITSFPPNADVYIDGSFAGKTPYTVTFLLNNKMGTAYEPVESPKQIKVEISGYEPEIKAYNRIDRMSEVPRHLTHFELKPLHSSNTQGFSVYRLNQPISGHVQEERGQLTATPIGDRWAVVIGISTYGDSIIPALRYASSDAQAFYDWAISPKGGKYSPARTKLLLNEKATSANIKDALFNWIGQAIEEDVVTIYFAGHGSPQSPDHPNNLFLLPYDCRYDNIATTGFPMWDIETALKRFIKAKKVVVIADACHSGGVGQSFDVARRANRGIEINLISSGLQDLSKIGDGVAVISASDDKQFSQESRNWGGGHGVFTYFLLKGLNGEADYNKDSRITLGELIPYLSEQVRRETKNAQSPTVAGKFDPALSIGR